MPGREPLPFRLPVPGRDTIDDEGLQSVSHRVEGFLHLGDGVLTLEWTGTTQRQQVSLTELRDHVDALPVEWADIPLTWLTEVRLRGGRWRPAVELRTRRVDAFEGIPSARPGSLALRIRRRDRALALRLVAAIESARTEAIMPPAEERAQLGSGDVDPDEPDETH